MADQPSEKYMKQADLLAVRYTYSERPAYVLRLALALDAARKEALEEAAHLIDNMAKAASKAGDVVMKKEAEFYAGEIRGLADEPPAPPADGKAVAAAMKEVAKRGLRGRRNG